MASGINADQNFYSESNLPLPRSPQSLHNHQRLHQNHQEHRSDYDRYQSYQSSRPSNYEGLNFGSKSPSLARFAHHSRSNEEAFEANRYGFGVDDGGIPEEFYKEYRGAQQSQNGYTEATDMAATTEARPSTSSLRSNGNGTTPKHPSVSNNRNGTRTAYRSVSVPVENSQSNPKATSATNGLSDSPPSRVKALLKKFDSNISEPSATPPRPAPGKKDTMVASRCGKARAGYMTPTNSSSHMAEGSPKAGTATREGARVNTGSTPRSAQRSKFAAEDQHSNNTLSSSARPARLRTTPIPTVNTPKPSSIPSPISPQSPHSAARKPLFGEVLVNGGQVSGVGYGISRDTSATPLDPGIPAPVKHNRSQSDPDAEVSPSSPTAWYLGVIPALADVQPSKKAIHGHNRSHSEVADISANTLNGITNASVQPQVTPLSSQGPERPSAKPQSKLPLSSHRLSNPSDSSRSSSSRPSSPYSKKASSRLQKPAQRPWSPGGRALTPTNRSTTPNRPSSRAVRRSPEKLSVSKGSLSAYISASPPNPSPPLRSSRPRQHVSAATTESSRRKAADRPHSPHNARTGMRVTRNAPSDNAKYRPTEEIGKAEFASAAARVKRGMTKSYNKQEQAEKRAANQQRYNEKLAQEASLDHANAAEQREPTTPVGSPTEISASTPRPLQVSTSFTAPIVRVDGQNALDSDSPTLGMPAAFVDDDYPESAISNATSITEFEPEAQAEAGRLQRMPSTKRSGSTKQSMKSPVIGCAFPDSPFHNLGSVSSESIQIMLEPAPGEEHEITPTRDDFVGDGGLSLPGSFRQESSLTAHDHGDGMTASTEGSPFTSTPASPIDDRYRRDSFPQIYTSGDPAAEEDSPLTSPHAYLSPKLELPALRTALSSSPGHDEDDRERFQNSMADEEDDDNSDEKSVGGSRLVARKSYDPYREYSPIMNHQSVWSDYTVHTGATHPSLIVSNISRQSDSQVREPLSPDSAIVPYYDESPLSSPATMQHLQAVDPDHPQLPPLTSHNGFGLGFDDSPIYSIPTVPMYPNYTPPLPPSQASDHAHHSPTRSPPPPAVHIEADGTLESRRGSDDIYSSQASLSTRRSSAQPSMEGQSDGHQDGLDKPAPLTEEETEAFENMRKGLKNRAFAVEELINTELAYVKDMAVVMEIYKGTAPACPNMDPSDIKLIFRNVDKLVAFITTLCDELKTAASGIYVPARGVTRPGPKGKSPVSAQIANKSVDEIQTLVKEDRKTTIGKVFLEHGQQLQDLYTDWLKDSEVANSRLMQLQTEAAVQVWLSECDLVAKDLTNAWDLPAMLVKPLQRVTRYPLMINGIKDATPKDHPEYQDLDAAFHEMGRILEYANSMKKRLEKVNQIISRKRKESNAVRAGFTKAFQRTDKSQNWNGLRPDDDGVYVKLHEKYSDDYLRLQVVLRDVEFYTRQVASYVRNFLQFLSSIELVMRMSASNHPEIESKWARFNMSMRDMGTVALEDHVIGIRKGVIQPFEAVIQAYAPPSVAMKKRNKRRYDYERYLTLHSSGKKIDDKLQELVDQYEALNETLKLELPKLSSLTEKIGNICLGNFVQLQAKWYGIWQEKVRVVLEANQMPKDIEDVVESFNKDYKCQLGEMEKLGIVHGTFDDASTKTRGSHSTKDDDSMRSKERPSNASSRPRGLSIHSDKSPSIPTPDLAKRFSGQFTFSPIAATSPGFTQGPYNPQTYAHGHSRNGSSASPATLDPQPRMHNHARPDTGRSATSDNGVPRVSTETSVQSQRESTSTYGSRSPYVDGPLQSGRPYSGLFHSTLHSDGPEQSGRSSRSSSRDRSLSHGYKDRYQVLYLAASLFEFNISTVKQESGFPYLTYSAGEIFDVIGEKGELWLAKNQDDPTQNVGWIWSKHFARLAT